MVSLKDFDPEEVIEKAKRELKSKKDVKPPRWSLYIKTGAGRERPPEQKDWWYTRAASVLKRTYLEGPIGVNKLKKRYGNRKKRGVKPEKSYKGSGKVLRTILQQLEKTGFVEKKGGGRVLTRKGRSFLDKLVSKKQSKKIKSPAKGSVKKTTKKKPAKKSKTPKKSNKSSTKKQTKPKGKPPVKK